MKNILTALLLTAVIFSSVIAGPARADDQCSKPVSTAEGMVRGKPATGAEACTWKGIPYAAPPVGDLRFRATQPAKAHQGVLDAYEFGPACPQKSSGFSGGEVSSFNEDCLTLNIWSPEKPGKYPVMVWIHGGAFSMGASSFGLYDGARLTGLKDVVVVSINYRLGALGFLSLPELAEEDPHASTGNYGLLDQIQALKWVQQNISKFGGDPGNVTIFGQSAGGMSVCSLLVSPLAKGLFQKAIPMSGACDFIPQKEEGYEFGKKMAEKAGCKDKDLLACLRKKPADAFLPKSVVSDFLTGFTSGAGFVPKFDGYVFTCQPLECIQQGNYNQVPVMMGFTRDEIKLFTSAIPFMDLLSRSLVKKVLRMMTGDAGDGFLKFYSFADYQHPGDLLNAAGTDYFSAAGFADVEALSKRTPVYYYRFDWDDIKDPKKYGAFHGLDIPFVFGNDNPDSKLVRKVRAKDTNPANIPLYKQIMSYYTDFAKTGDPNGPGLPAWPKYSVDKKERLYLDNQITVAPLLPKDIDRYQYFNKRNQDKYSSGKK
jgi:para-nitrobenzyl esterase